MKAMVYKKYGSPNNLELQDIEVPVPKENEVLIQVYASSINSWDLEIVLGRPFISRGTGFFRPRYGVVGCDVAGRVESVGKNVQRFKPGDEVYGDLSSSGWGCFAEYVCASVKAIRHKPTIMSFEQAAAVPQSGLLALQSLFDQGMLCAGEKVLINGAGGCVGSFAIQMAKAVGAEVTAVDSAEKLEMMRSLGADHVIDYTKEDFSRNGRQYDLILDNIVRRTIRSYKRALVPGGRLVMSGGRLRRILGIAIIGLFDCKKKYRILPHVPNKGLDRFEEMYNDGKVVPYIGEKYSLVELPAALQKLAEGRVKGKVVIAIKASL